jgi:hypothetical protein
MIPDKSEASINKGNWFIHHDGINIIQIWGSNLNGKEKVFLNNELVSEQRSIKMQNIHNFTDKNGKNYEVIFETESLMKGCLKCILKRDDHILRTFKTEYKKGKNLTLKRFSIIILVSAIFGVLQGIYALSDLTFKLFLAALLIISFVTRNKGEIKIKEE